jgi:hypothetical protein
MMETAFEFIAECIRVECRSCDTPSFRILYNKKDSGKERENQNGGNVETCDKTERKEIGKLFSGFMS